MSNPHVTAIKRVEKIPWQVLDGCALILTPQQSMAHELNEVATWIWQEIATETLVSDLAVKLTEVFDVDLQTADSDIRAFAREMESKGMVQCQ